MTKRVTSRTQPGSPSYPGSAFAPCVAAFFAASLLFGCSSDSGPTSPKDASKDGPKDTVTSPTDVGADSATPDLATDSANKDLADAAGCYDNGVFYSPGATVTRPGACLTTCTCLSTGAIGLCSTTCYDGSVQPDTRPPGDVPPTDSPIVCTRAGRTYDPGESVPLNDGCGGSCFCSSTGTLVNCTPACTVDGGLDVPKDTTPDQHDVAPPVDVTPPIDTTCVAGVACTLGTGAKGFCAAGACTACAGATDDAKCKTAYGTGNICISGACTPGDCHDSAGCSDGRLCGSSVAHACGDCTTDAQCTGDTHYGAGHLCVNHLCVAGNCHDTSAECTGTRVGQVCGVTTDHTCGACTSDTQCANDATYSAAATLKTLCATKTGLTTTGQCVANNTSGTGNICANADNNHVCPVNSADFCCANKCVPGNCCADSDCTTLGSDFVCRQNTCTRCDSVSGNAYFVDPIGGDDETATGSGLSGTTAAPACSFRTLKQALIVVNALGATAPAGTTITIVGQATGNTSLYTVAAGGITNVEELPIRVPANVTIKTKTGPVILNFRTTDTNTAGFRLAGAGASISPITAAPLTINGQNRTGSVGILVASGTASLGNITVTNTASDGIQVTGGTADFLAGISVTATTGTNANGISITGGTAHIDTGITVTDANANGINITGGTTTMGGGVNVTGAGQHGIAISAGTVAINAGVSVRTSGANGLNIQGTGAATITVTSATATPSVFDSNTESGISVAGTGVLTISGATVTGSTVRTVSAKGNTASNVYFASTSATLSTIDHFYSYNSTVDGLRIVAGSNIQVRNSMFKSNAHNGVNIISGADSDLTGIDLGTAADPGDNTLQSAAGSGPNSYAGLCVNLTVAPTTQTLKAAANVFAGKDCTATNPGAIAASATCAAATNIGVPAGNITFVASNCTVTGP